MAITLTDTERRLLAEIQHGMPATSTPYMDVAAKIGVDIEDVLAILNNWKNDGRLRRVGAIVNHFKVGLKAGAMVVWQVEEDRVEEVGKTLASFPEVSHAYERPSNDRWPFNVYTMIHGQEVDDVKDTILKMSAKVGIKNYKQLETIRELKKVPPTYILDK